ncbi:hypothetical protein EJ07DRAFT_96580, partial [Lizonia empirigonia]
FRIPEHLTSNVYRRSNGFFAFEQSLIQDGDPQVYCTWFRFLVKTLLPNDAGYTWREMTFFSRWDSQSCNILCIGVDLHFQQLLQSILARMWSGLPPSEQYSMHVPVIEAVVALHDLSVWSVRDSVRNVEKASKVRSSEFVLLHETARHAIHVHETINVSVETLQAIQHQALILSRTNRQRSGENPDDFDQIQASVDSQVRLSRNLLSRAQSNKERLQNEIELAYNVISQRDSQVMKALGEAGRSDSRAMRTIAVVTMAFLPPTFLSAIFSTSFFNFNPGNAGEGPRWLVSDKFWIYWVFAIPLTCLTLVTWFWQQRLEERPLGGVTRREVVGCKTLSSMYIDSRLA